MNKQKKWMKNTIILQMKQGNGLITLIIKKVSIVNILIDNYSTIGKSY